MDLRYANAYGGFSADGWQYEITSPDPPRAWFNVLLNRTFLAQVSQAGTGPSGRLGPSADTVSLAHRAFYVRDRETGEVWSPTGAPAGAPLVNFRCVHRPDCTVIESERAGIGARLRVFVPVEGDVSIWTLTLRNYTDERRALSLFSFVPMRPVAAHPPNPSPPAPLPMGEGGGVRVPAHPWAGAPQGGASRYAPDLGAILVTAGYNWGDGGPTGYVAARPLPDHTEGSQEAFLGGAGRWDRPAAVAAGRLADGAGWGEALCGGLQHDVVLDGGASWGMRLAVGCEETREAVGLSVARFTDPDGVEALFEENWVLWQDLVGAGWLQTPDAEVDLALNVWLKRQLLVQVWSRQRTKVRDFEDAVGLLPWDAEPCRAALLGAFGRQDSTGAIAAEWAAAAPATGDASTLGVLRPLPAGAHQPHPRAGASHHTPIWAAWALAAYVSETGDAAFLRQEVPFCDKRRAVSILEHAVQGLRYTAGSTGQHRLCLSDAGEGVVQHSAAAADSGVRGECVLTSLGLALAGRTLAQVAEEAGQAGAAGELRALADSVASAINAAAWDGAWYIRGYADDGQRFGTHGEPAGRIYLEPQTWAVLAGVADAERAGQAMDSVGRHLETACGPAVLAPPYTQPIPRIGPLTRMMPGAAANGSVEARAAALHACALAALGQGDRAMEVFRLVLPTVRQHPVERSRHLPIWLPAYYVAPACEGGGLASPLGVTGAVAWSFIFIREYVFGVRPGPAGLTVRPCIPASWRECQMVRRFRGDEYEVIVRNPRGLQTGRARLELDGLPIDGDVVPLVGDGRHHRVVATLEAAAE